MIKGYVVGDGEVRAKLERVGRGFRTELSASIYRLATKLRLRVETKVNGQVIGVRTGRLRKSIMATTNEVGDKTIGIVATAVRYAPIHEYGFHGTENVRAHLRRVKQAFGRPISPRDVEVTAHARKVTLPARSFLRSALRELESSGDIRAELEAAVARAKAK